MSSETTMPKTGEPINANYVLGYAIGYFYGREVGDAEPGRTELAERFGEAAYHDGTNAGFKVGYDDGVNDYVCATETGWTDA